MKTVLLLLANGFELYEGSVFIDVIGWNGTEGDKCTTLKTCGITKEVKTSFGQKVIVDYLISEIKFTDYDALAIPGGFEDFNFYDDAFSVAFQNIIRQFNSDNKIIATICVAALALGKSGVLTGRNGTTYNQNNGKRQKQLKEFGVIVKDQPIVIDNNIITSWNPSTAMEVAFILLEKLTSIKQREFIMGIMGY
jgi:protein deglycase